MTTREQKYTKVSEFQVRFDAWKDAIVSTERHIILARNFQATGGDIIKQLQEESKHPNQNTERQVKLHQTCLINIERGMKIEREARQELLRLYAVEPKE